MNHSLLRLRSCLPVLALLLAAAAPLRADDKSRSLEVSSAFSASRFLDHIKYLSSDELGGRGTGTPGLEAAAEYVIRHLKQAGCEPAGDDGTFLQHFEVGQGKEIDDASKLVIDAAGGQLKLDQDWRPFPFTESEKAEGGLAFVGYGIEAPDHEYNDYADIDVKGKILLMFRYEPRSEDEDAELGGRRASRFALFATKARTALEHGAVGILVVDTRDEDDQLYPFRSNESRREYGLPMASITRAVADKLLARGGLPSSRELEEAIEDDRKPRSKVIEGVNATLDARTRRKMIKTANVVGMLKGNGSSDEIIVVGAHYDHLGTQGDGDDKRVYNGADDNASGTSAVIELARVLGSGPKLRRNVLFMTFSGEEMGLLGSRHFVTHPTVDLSKIRAMFNMDMVGRFGQDRFEIWGTDTAEEFPELIERVTAAAGIDYKAPTRSGNIFGRSDHASFYRHDIPVLFPFTGLHQEYHQPEDDWPLVDAEGGVKVLQMAHLIVSELACMENGPTFTTAGRTAGAPVAVAKADDKPAKGEDDQEEQADDAAPPMPKVRMGIMPGYAEDGKTGMMVDGVIEKGPAEKAGIQRGDRIIRIAGKEVNDIYTYMTALTGLKPDDTVEVVLLREGKELTVKIKLGEPVRGNEPK